jgi:hypothetical protein
MIKFTTKCMSNFTALVLTLSDVSNNSVAINSPSVFRSCSSSDSSSCILRRRLNLFYNKFIRNTVKPPYQDYRTIINISYTRTDTKVREPQILMQPVNTQYQKVDAKVYFKGTGYLFLKPLSSTKQTKQQAHLLFS